MELSDLVGKHMLSGVNEGSAPVKEVWGDGTRDCQTITFELDGVAYQAIENPEDGYRSSMREVKAVPNTEITNRFEPVEVFGAMRLQCSCEKNDVLNLYDTANGKIILSVGTRNTNDYYPWWVAEWTPENMAVNEAERAARQ